MARAPIGYLLSDVSRLIRHEFQSDPAMGEMTLAQARALSLISRHEGIKQVELAELLEIKPMTLGRIIDQLVETGLIERRPNPSDRRAYLIYLLPAAQPELDHIQMAGSRVWANALEGLSETEIEAFVQTLERIHKNLPSY
ncbi:MULTISPECIES: MarR family winged helix-turn-helix transcriptional regulator [Vibrio]|uniref:MarR family transcriptional regulator n=1 Tax=Vibrio algicola TaxID=2662262 RepID=A0A5Q0TG76_9VIBR|nr:MULTISPECIES: MarR family transcriptional regulator [Vibrio]MBD1575419.1 MarR family transcriptional regulator [Vibrio sp. S11_S32]